MSTDLFEGRPAPSVQPSLATRLANAFVHFIAAPATARPLAALRIGVATVLLCQALAIAASLLDLFGARGVIQWSLSEVMILPGMPRIRWLVEALAPLGVSEDATVRAVFLLYVGSLSALLFGWHTRIAAVLAWFTHLTLMMSERSSLYGVDDFAHIILFYFMWMPVGHYWSFDVADGRASTDPTFAARLSLRVIQIHLCVVYLSSGIEKALADGSQWWTGEVLWKALTMPTFAQFDLTWLADYPWLVKLATWGSLGIELSYAFLIWPKRTRKFMAINTIAMHVGIAIFMRMISFGALMMVFTGATWLFSPEPASEQKQTAG